MKASAIPRDVLGVLSGDRRTISSWFNSSR
jgi:hypothetical protein